MKDEPTDRPDGRPAMCVSIWGHWGEHYLVTIGVGDVCLRCGDRPDRPADPDLFPDPRTTTEVPF
jgi:hypothetical protein